MDFKKKMSRESGKYCIEVSLSSVNHLARAAEASEALK